MQQSSTKGLGEGAMMAALTAIFAMSGIYIPFLSVLTMLIVAVPITLVIVRNNFKIGAISSVVAGFLVATLAGPLMAVTFYIQFMSLALVYGYLFKKKAKAGKIIVAGAAISVLSTFLLLVLSFAVINVDFESQKEMLLNTLDETIIIYEDQGLLDQLSEQGVSKEEFRETMLNSLKLLFTILPAILIVMSVFSAAINFIVTRTILRRFKHEVSKLPPFKEWSLPWYTIWGIILGWTFYLLGDYLNLDIGIFISKNILIVFAFLVLIQGLAVMAFLLAKLKLNNFSKVALIFLLILLLRHVVVIAIVTGLFDLLLDYRKMISDGIFKKKKK